MTRTEEGIAEKTVEVVLDGGLRFTGRGPSGARVILDTGTSDEPPPGFSPMESVLISLGGCTAMDVIEILRKKRLGISDYRVRVSGVRADEHPRVYTSIAVHHIVSGSGIPEAAVRQAIELSTDTYCSVHAMLSKTAGITTTFEIREV